VSGQQVFPMPPFAIPHTSQVHRGYLGLTKKELYAAMFTSALISNATVINDLSPEQVIKAAMAYAELLDNKLGGTNEAVP
jgi:hypothetical protein